MTNKHWIDELIDNGDCYLCTDKFYYYKNGIKKHRNISCINGEAYCEPCGKIKRRNNLKPGDLIYPGDDMDGATLCDWCGMHFKGDGNLERCNDCERRQDDGVSL